ncbi:MAG: LacI family DNA-binding transcriptional regulator, partial [Veillonella sp.]|nr:LacI family DNA-binding transcriptional regulator [Veillonella sp.]
FMSEATRQRIAEAIGKSEYKPNEMARSLRLQQSQMIGVLVSDITSPFSSFLFKGITEQCERPGTRCS